MKFKIGNYEVKVEPILPEIGFIYHHKDRDPEDMVDYVVPKKIEGNLVTYRKVYKDRSILSVDDISTVSEFNKWYRKGR